MMHHYDVIPLSVFPPAAGDTRCHRSSTCLSAVLSKPAVEMAVMRTAVHREMGIPNLAAFYLIFMLHRLWQSLTWVSCRISANRWRREHIHTLPQREMSTMNRLGQEGCIQVIKCALTVLYLLSLSIVWCVCSVFAPCRVCSRRRNSLAAWSFSPADLKWGIPLDWTQTSFNASFLPPFPPSVFLSVCLPVSASLFNLLFQRIVLFLFCCLYFCAPSPYFCASFRCFFFLPFMFVVMVSFFVWTCVWVR